MRLLSAILFVALTTSSALAEEPNATDPKPEVTRKKVPYRVVKTLPDSQQVLLFDKIHGTHLVAEVGEPLDDGYTVEEIDDDEVTLLAEDGTPVILAEPPPPRQPKRVVAKPKAKPAVEKPVDPYAGVPDAIDAEATPEAEAVTPVDPYGDPQVADRAPTAVKPPAPVIIDAGPAALADPYTDPGVAAFAAAVAAEPPAASPAPEPAVKRKKKSKASKPETASPDAATSLAAVVTGSPEPAVAVPLTNAPTATAAAAPTSSEGIIALAHGELDAALGDFSKLAGTFRASFTNDGVRFEAVNAGTLLAKIGLRRGDLVTSVDGKPLRTLDDAASLYARSTTMKLATVQVVRDGKPMVLRVAIR